MTVTDGPFTESKELSSYAVYDVRSREEARAEFARAAALTGNERERALFLARAAECGPGASRS